MFKKKKNHKHSEKFLLIAIGEGPPVPDPQCPSMIPFQYTVAHPAQWPSEYSPLAHPPSARARLPTSSGIPADAQSTAPRRSAL
ncbi:hypothetical protein K469DRAFT_710204 [Zopfia rhizophila CBS 207.26]|uniref:Uncharacterized protein n=1 Tax=Zopfia rhizophila CBS 207.26 TaxID=1314779 RepID=A0A6A6E1Q8_9PEZI|nr:hypothetical protein K469DRAFT_710204 [Zopfia rhizophila CBS 207.26]